MARRPCTCSDARATMKHNLPLLTIDWVWFRRRTCVQADHPMRLVNGTWEYPMRWWSDYLDDVLAILRETPGTEVIKQEHSRCLEKAMRGAAGCTTCQQHVAMHMHTFSQRLLSLIDTEVSKVKLPTFLSRDAELEAAHRRAAQPVGREVYTYSVVEPKDDSTSAWLEQHVPIFDYSLCLNGTSLNAVSLTAICELFPLMEPKTLLLGSYFPTPLEWPYSTRCLDAVTELRLYGNGIGMDILLSLNVSPSALLCP
ncbi:hypothetical protein C8Q72DRAFT_434752 [Fomitopsis betulina]|nr:hypothetical protein C8Q72DRAFT_434752 [Fomitopsis betulina]